MPCRLSDPDSIRYLKTPVGNDRGFFVVAATIVVNQTLWPLPKHPTAVVARSTLQAVGVWLGYVIVAGLIVAAASRATAAGPGSRIYRCQGAHGEPVFRDQSCRGVGLQPRRSAAAATVPVAANEDPSAADANAGDGRCRFESAQLRFADPAFDDSDARLTIGYDADGPRFAIRVTGTYRRGDGSEADVTLDPRIEGQGVQLSEGRLLAADSRSQENRLEFGRSRSRHMLTAVATNQISLSIWFSGYQQPVLSDALSGAEILTSVDAARRCFQLAERRPR